MQDRRVESNLLLGLLVLLGVSAMGIALLVLALGIDAVILVEDLYDGLIGRQSPPTTDVSPTLDSELRFYAPFWFGYGVLLLWVTQQINQRLRLVPILALLFLSGGIGRVASLVIVGSPHPAFIVLMILELALPPVLLLLYWRLRPS